MRVVKSLWQGLLCAPFSWRQQHRLGVASLLAFELGQPNNVLISEQQLWQRLLPQLEGMTLDVAMPKSQGEWLIKGAACTPVARSHVRVAAAVAGVEKRLDVYGPRHWLTNGHASEPQPFTYQCLRWQEAFGGPGDADNPLGCSREKPAAIFYPQQQQLIRDQVVAAAGFLPLAADHPLQTRYQGNYDANWLRDHWPGLPPDLDWRYFNVAPIDQRLQGFFQPGDPYTLVNLHPQESQIAGQLPTHRVRAFIEYQQGECAELPLQCDTVWLFPEQRVGVMIYRGVASISDDEGLDVKQLILGVESAESQVLPAADYWAQARQDAVEAEMTPAFSAEAAAQLVQAEKTLADLPKLLQFKWDQIGGQAPTPQASLLEQQEMVQQQIVEHLDRLSTAKDWLGTQPIPATLLNTVESAGDQLLEIRQALQGLPEQLTDIQQQIAQADLAAHSLPNAADEVSSAAKQARQQLATFAQIEKHWQAQAGRLVSLAQHGLEKAQQRQKTVQALGIRLLTQQRYLLGYLDQPIPFISEDWGLEPGAVAAAAALTSVGPGWLLPEFHQGVFTALTIRPDQLSQSQREYRLPGSQPDFWCSGLQPNRAKVLVPELVIGWRLAQEVDHLVDVVLLPDPEAELTPKIAEALERAKLLLVPLTDSQSIVTWQRRFPQIRCLPLGEYASLEARLASQSDQCQWLLTALPTECVPPPAVEPDADAFLEATLASIGKAVGTPDLLAVDAQWAQQLQILEQEVATLPEAVQALLAPALATTQPETTLELPAQLGVAKAAAQEALTLLAELNTRQPALDAVDAITSFQQQINTLLEQAEHLLAAGAAMHTHQQAEQSVHAYPALDRAQVITAYRDGASLARVNLSGIDLSRLELAGVDLTESILTQTNFSASNLSGACLVGIIASQARFTAACLVGADLSQALLPEADLSNIQGKACQLTEAMLKGARLEDADLSGAKLHALMAEGASFQRASLLRADLTDAFLLGADLSDANLTEALLESATLNQATLSRACLVATRGQSTNFWAIGAMAADFSQAFLPNARFGPACLTNAQLREAKLPGSNMMQAQADSADFSGCDLCAAYINQSDLRQANLVGADLRNAQVVRSNLEGAQLRGANLFQASLFKSRFVAADFRDANLFNADLRQVVIGKTQFQGANLRRTLLEAHIPSAGERGSHDAR